MDQEVQCRDSYTEVLRSQLSLTFSALSTMETATVDFTRDILSSLMVALTAYVIINLRIPISLAIGSLVLYTASELSNIATN